MKGPAPTRRDRLRHILADLRMPGALEALDAILQGVDGGALTAPEAIEQLLAAQIQLRNNRRLQAALRSSRLPVVKQLGDFDVTFQPSLRREQIESLHELGFVERRENVIFLGPGVGKTQVSIAREADAEGQDDEDRAIAGLDEVIAGRLRPEVNSSRRLFWASNRTANKTMGES